MATWKIGGWLYVMRRNLRCEKGFDTNKPEVWPNFSLKSSVISSCPRSTVCHDHLRKVGFIKTDLALGLVTLSVGANPILPGLVTLSYNEQKGTVRWKLPSRRSPMSLTAVFQVKHNFCLVSNQWRAHLEVRIKGRPFKPGWHWDLCHKPFPSRRT